VKPITWYRKQSVQLKIFIPFFIITFLSSTVFTIYGFFHNSQAIVNEIDKRLLIATLTMEQLLPRDYFDRVQGPGSINKEEHALHTIRLNQFLKNVGATYLYALFKENGKYYFVAAADFDFATKYWEEYKQPAPNIYEIEKNWQPHISTTNDPEYGLLRSVVIPHTDTSGRRFIIGADIHAYEVEALKRRAFLNFLLMGSVSFLMAILFSYAASRTISSPLVRLSSFTRRLAENDFSSSIRLDPALFPDGEQTRAETAILAFDFDTMQRKMEAHIEQLKWTQSARERAESELRIAGKIQETFLPPPFKPECFNSRVQLHASMKTAKQAGGDLFDFAVLDDDHLFFALGDVSGKGMPAAMFMSVVVVLLRSAAKQFRDPAEIVRRVNEELAYRNESCTFVTLFVGILDVRNGEVVFVNGGHNPPCLLTGEGSVSTIPTQSNLVVGVFPGQSFARETLVLRPGETLFLYTDGITEAIDETNAFYGKERMNQCLAALPPEASVADVVRGIDADVAAFSGDCEQADDITMLCLRYQGKQNTI